MDRDARGIIALRRRYSEVKCQTRIRNRKKLLILFFLRSNPDIVRRKQLRVWYLCFDIDALKPGFLALRRGKDEIVLVSEFFVESVQVGLERDKCRCAQSETFSAALL